jgi:CMP-N-acetylneuraminic acid synthetase
LSSKITCFLPCRQGSQRVPRKNVKPFSNFKNGLIEIKLTQLIESQLIDEILLSTNDEEILDYAASLNNKKIKLHRRSESLSLSETSTDQLITHATDLITSGDILWTHVTSPFITAGKYDEIIATYRQCLESGYDSLMTTTPIQGFLWQNGKPINYNRNKEKWPQTQTIKPVHEINSGVFINSVKNYRKLNDRIGQQPYLYILDKIQGFDIDWDEDFKIAECLSKIRNNLNI